MLAGAGAGLVSSIATCPLDVIKTKLQAQHHAHGHREYLGVVGTLKDVLRRDGVKGLYRGLGPTILGYLPTWAIYFAVYDGIKRKLADEDLESVARRHVVYPAAQPKGYHPHAREHPWSVHILSAMIAGGTSTMATNPLWVVKTRFMTQSADEVRYRHTFDAIQTIYRKEGIRAFYRGIFPSLLGIFHVAVQFPLYEQLKVWARRGDPDATLTSTSILACSGASKMVASIATYPHEVVRTRLQIQRRELSIPPPTSSLPAKAHPGVVQTVRNIITREGWRGLYKGLSINLLRTVPNSAVTMLTYELLMRYLGKH